MDLTFFNPHSQTETDFLASFVARGEILDYFLRQLRLLSKSEPARHQLIVAPRGYGKTSLLRRLAIAVRVDADLTAKFIPLTFREEQHNVISLDVFWRNCLQSLAETREDEQGFEEEIRELEAAWMKHVPRQTLGRDEQDGEPAWREFQAHCIRLGRRPLLLIDNVDSLLAGLPAKQHWSLRGILQQESGPVLIAAAPQFPGSIHDPSAAFYDFFRIETLDKLSDFEVTRCLRTMAWRRGKPGKVVLDLLDKDPGRIVALNTLAGGNPRTLNVLYSVLESHMSADLLAQLSAMLDTFTSWYHSRTEDLPSQARAVFDALALNWNPMTAAAMGAVTGLDTTAVSSQISRLEKAGLVEAVALNRRGKGRNGYQLSERFFNIWYLMRNGPRRTRQSIRFLAVFLQSCFSVAERRSLAGQVMTSDSVNPAYALGLAASLPASALRDRLLEHTEMQSSLSGEKEEYGASIQEMRRGGRRPPEGERKLAQLDRAIRRIERAADYESSLKLAKTLVEKGKTLLELRRFEQAVELYGGVSTRYFDASDPALREPVARAFIGKGIALRRLERFEEALECQNAVLARFGDTIEPALRELVAKALFGKGVTLGQLGRHEQAVETYDNVVARFGDVVEPALREQVAGALVNKGYALVQLGRHEQAVETYDNVLTRFGDVVEPALRERVARALVNKGNPLRQLGRLEVAIETYDNVVARFGDAAEPVLREQVAIALFGKGLTLLELGRHEQAVETCDNVLERFGDTAEPVLREHVAWALVNKGYALGELGRHEQAVETYDKVMARFGEAAEPFLREHLARALVNKGHTLAQLGRHDQAVETASDVLTRFGDAAEPSLRELVAKAFVNRGYSLRELGHSEVAIETYDSLLIRFGDAEEPALCEQVANALVNKGHALGQLGRHDQAIETYDEVLTRFGGAAEPVLREQVAKALVNKGYALGQIGRHEQAFETYDDVLTRFGDFEEPVLREAVARAVYNKGATFGQLGRHEQAIEAYESVLTRFNDAPEPAVRELVYWALLKLSDSLSEMGQSQRAAATLRQAATTAATGELRGNTWNHLGNLLLDFLGDPAAAIAAFESGEAVDPTSEVRALLHANSAFALIMHGGDRARARDHLLQAFADDGGISLAGLHMLGALRSLQESPSTPWPQVFKQIGLAVESGDTNLTSNYLGALQRLIWFTVAVGEGGSLHRWMDEKDYAMRYAPLYYAILAAIEGEDLLLQINPETRQAAVRIHEGIARMLKLYGGPDRTRHVQGLQKQIATQI